MQDVDIHLKTNFYQYIGDKNFRFFVDKIHKRIFWKIHQRITFGNLYLILTKYIWGALLTTIIREWQNPYTKRNADNRSKNQLSDISLWNSDCVGWKAQLISLCLFLSYLCKITIVPICILFHLHLHEINVSKWKRENTIKQDPKIHSDADILALRDLLKGPCKEHF